MVRIRLRRTGAKKQPHYRVVVADQRTSRDGRFIEIVGYYNPRTDPPTVNIKQDRALYWLGQGAQPSEAVAQMLKRQGTLERLARLKAGESLEALLAEYEEPEEDAEASELEVQAEVEPVVEAQPTIEAEESEELPDDQEDWSPTMAD